MDRTAEILNLGIVPAYAGVSSKTYARNPWDLLADNGRVLIGVGNASNYSPAANAGAAPIYSVDLSTETFNLEYTTFDQQVQIFKKIGSDIYVPGIDQVSGHNNYYKCVAGVWSKITPNYAPFNQGKHLYDVTEFNGALFSAHGSSFNPSIGKSTDGGTTWTTVVTNPTLGRNYRIFSFNSSLYLAGGRNPVSKYNGSSFVSNTNSFFLGAEAYIGTLSTPSNSQPRIERVVTFNSKLCYVVGLTVNDHQWEPFSFNVATTATNVAVVNLGTDVKVWDTKVFGTTLYLLTSKLEGTQQRIGVYSSTDAVNFTEDFYFYSNTFARSFERVQDGRWFFGLGCSHTSVSTLTGTILKLPN